MTTTIPLAPVLRAAANPRRLARKTIRNPSLLEGVIAGLDAEAARTKFGCAKALRILSEERPELLYPKFDLFARLLDHKNKILQWHGVFVISQLARVDAQDRFAAIFDRYFAPIPGPVMITAANVIQGAARIARAKPQLADRIAREVLKVAGARYQTAECQNVAIGHAVLALDGFFDLIRDRAPALGFVRRHLHNPRPATRKKAEAFLKRWR